MLILDHNCVYVVCIAMQLVHTVVSGGSWENWRPDKGDFPDSVKGKTLDGWQGRVPSSIFALWPCFRWKVAWYQSIGCACAHHGGQIGFGCCKRMRWSWLVPYFIMQIDSAASCTRIPTLEHTHTQHTLTHTVAHRCLSHLRIILSNCFGLWHRLWSAHVYAEPDNMDGYINDNGFSLTKYHQLTYNQWMADEVYLHSSCATCWLNIFLVCQDIFVEAFILDTSNFMVVNRHINGSWQWLWKMISTKSNNLWTTLTLLLTSSALNTMNATPCFRSSITVRKLDKWTEDSSLSFSCSLAAAPSPLLLVHAT